MRLLVCQCLSYVACTWNGNPWHAQPPEPQKKRFHDLKQSWMFHGFMVSFSLDPLIHFSHLSHLPPAVAPIKALTCSKASFRAGAVSCNQLWRACALSWLSIWSVQRVSLGHYLAKGADFGAVCRPSSELNWSWKPWLENTSQVLIVYHYEPSLFIYRPWLP